MPAIGIRGEPLSASRPTNITAGAPRVPAIRLSCAGASHAGYARAHNEDAWRIDVPSGLLVLADGMGGYNAGEVASALAVEAIAANLSGGGEVCLLDGEPGDAMRVAIERANASIVSAAARRPECLGMGTTVVCAVVAAGRVLVGHVGDSRAYLLRGGVLARMTRDHSVSQALADAGIDTEPEAMRGVLTRALGVEREVDPDLCRADLQPGDRLLLCSDGLTDMLGDSAIAQLLGNAPSASVAAEALIAAALEAGGLDNVTALVAIAESTGVHDRLPQNGG